MYMHDYSLVFTSCWRRNLCLNHSINSLFLSVRLSEQSKLMADHKRLVGDLSNMYHGAVEWNVKHKDAFRTIHGAGLGALISHMQNPLDLGRSCVSNMLYHVIVM